MATTQINVKELRSLEDLGTTIVRGDGIRIREQTEQAPIVAAFGSRRGLNVSVFAWTNLTRDRIGVTGMFGETRVEKGTLVYDGRNTRYVVVDSTHEKFGELSKYLNLIS